MSLAFDQDEVVLGSTRTFSLLRLLLRLRVLCISSFERDYSYTSRRHFSHRVATILSGRSYEMGYRAEPRCWKVRN